MKPVKFKIDQHGPFDGTMKFGTLEDDRIDFLAIPVRATELTGARTITVTPGDAPEFVAQVIRITTDGGYRKEGDDAVTGYVVFKGN